MNIKLHNFRTNDHYLNISQNELNKLEPHMHIIIGAPINLMLEFLHFRNQNQSRLERINGDVHFVQKLSRLKAFNQ